MFVGLNNLMPLSLLLMAFFSKNESFAYLCGRCARKPRSRELTDLQLECSGHDWFGPVRRGGQVGGQEFFRAPCLARVLVDLDGSAIQFCVRSIKGCLDTFSRRWRLHVGQQYVEFRIEIIQRAAALAHE